MILAKSLVLFYVDLDEGGINIHVDEVLKTEKFSPEKYGVVAFLVWWQPGFLMLSSTFS